MGRTGNRPNPCKTGQKTEDFGALRCCLPPVASHCVGRGRIRFGGSVLRGQDPSALPHSTMTHGMGQITVFSAQNNVIFIAPFRFFPAMLGIVRAARGSPRSPGFASALFVAASAVSGTIRLFPASSLGYFPPLRFGSFRPRSARPAPPSAPLVYFRQRSARLAPPLHRRHSGISGSARPLSLVPYKQLSLIITPTPRLINAN